MYFLDDLDEEEYEIAIKVGYLTIFLQLTTKWGFKCEKKFYCPSGTFTGKSLSEVFFLKNMGKLFWMSETISVHNLFSPGLSLEFSCIELVFQWTICRDIVG